MFTWQLWQVEQVGQVIPWMISSRILSCFLQWQPLEEAPIRPSTWNWKKRMEIVLTWKASWACVCVYIFATAGIQKVTTEFYLHCEIYNDVYIIIKQYNLCISSTMLSWRPCKYCLILSGSRMNLLEGTQNKAIQRTTILYWHAQKFSTLPLTCDCLRSWPPMGPMAFWVPSFSWCFASGRHSKYSWSLEYEETTFFPV